MILRPVYLLDPQAHRRIKRRRVLRISGFWVTVIATGAAMLLMT